MVLASAAVIEHDPRENRNVLAERRQESCNGKTKLTTVSPMQQPCNNNNLSYTTYMEGRHSLASGKSSL